MDLPQAKKRKIQSKDYDLAQFFGFKDREFCLVKWKPDTKDGLTYNIVNRVNIKSC